MADAIFQTLLVAFGMFIAYWIGRDTGVKIGSNLGGQIKQAAEKMHETAQLIGKYEPPTFEAPVAIGAHFRYLGVDMICTAHSHQAPMLPLMYCVKAEYVANDGTVRMAFWPASEMGALSAEINRAATVGAEA